MGNGSLNLELRLKYPPSCNGGYSLVLIKSLDEEGTSPLKLVSREAMRPNHDDNLGGKSSWLSSHYPKRSIAPTGANQSGRQPRSILNVGRDHAITSARSGRDTSPQAWANRATVIA